MRCAGFQALTYQIPVMFIKWIHFQITISFRIAYDRIRQRIIFLFHPLLVSAI